MPTPTLSGLFSLDLASFAAYIKSIRYGYRDAFGSLHFAQEEHFSVRHYIFSLPADIAISGCGWCWDVANLIYAYCKHNGTPAFSAFLEYQSGDIHMTHTQCFVQAEDGWLAFPDNSSPQAWEEVPRYADGHTAAEQFVRDYIDYLAYTQKGRFVPSHFRAHKIDFEITSPISDEAYLAMARTGKPI